MRSRKILVLAVALAAACWTGRAAAQELSIELRDRFELFNSCRPLQLDSPRFLLADGHETAEAIGLTNEHIRALVEGRLRAARLFSASPSAGFGFPFSGAAGKPVLELSVYLTPADLAAAGIGDLDDFRVLLRFWKYLYDEVSDESRYRTTWEIGRRIYQSHDGDAGSILHRVSQLLDYFIGEYLRVNEAACRS